MPAAQARPPSSAAGSGPVVASWRGPCPPINSDHILRLHGYQDPARVRPAIRKAAEAAAPRAQGLVAAEGVFMRRPVARLADGMLELHGGGRLTCPAFAHHLDGAVEVVVFVLTLGDGFDAHVAAVGAGGDALAALFLETAGRLAIEKLTRRLAADVAAQLARDGLALGARLGPGYTYRQDGRSAAQRVEWSLAEQHELFALFGAARLPVRLLESAVMLPKMSRSGLFGVRPA